VGRVRLQQRQPVRLQLDRELADVASVTDPDKFPTAARAVAAVLAEARVALAKIRGI